ncbi:MAG: T9SS type A sorting domain-containing protein [Gemmatimonadota bacterium]|nr:MAG: T9SS type A sorting domain-containing protein [Gemmatimonadota bacterium]
MKHPVTFIVSFVLMAFLAGSINGDTLSVASGEGERGSTGNIISVDLNNDVGVWGVQFDLIFDSSVLTLDDVDTTDRAEQFDFFVYNRINPNNVRFIMFFGSFDVLLPGTGSIVDLSFSVATDARPGEYPLTLQRVQVTDTLGAILPFDLVNGIFKVTVVLDSLRITPRPAEVACAETQQFTATGYDTQGQPVDLDALWDVLPTHLGQINATGLFTADSQGTGWVYATFETWEDSVSLNVIPGEPETVDVEPDSATLVSGTQQLFTVEGVDECGNMFEPAVIWAVHPQDLGTIDQTGQFTAVKAGSGWIVASGSPEDSSFVTVVVGPLDSIDISPDAGTLVCNNTLQFTAQGFDANGNDVTVDPDWAVVPEDLGDIDTTGLFTASRIGEGWVLVGQDAIFDSAHVVVEGGALTVLDIEPDVAEVVSGENRQFTALGYDDCGNSITFQPEWSVSPPELGTIDSNGLFLAQVEGQGWVIVSGSAQDSAQVTVQHGWATSLNLTPEEAFAAPGDSIVYTATASDGINEWDVTDLIIWSTTDPSGAFSDNIYIAGTEGEWLVIATHTVPLSDTVHVTVSITDVAFALPLTPGWNMISLPIVPETLDIDVLFPNALAQWKYAGGYQWLDDVELCTGFWIFVDEADTVNIVGEPIRTCCLDMLTGWNLVGSVICEMPIDEIVDTTTWEFPIYVSPMNVWAWQVGGYMPVSEIDPGAAVWLLAESPGTVCFSCDSLEALKTTSNMPKLTDPSWKASIHLESTGERKTLEFGVHEDATAGIDRGFDVAVPPLPPGDNVRTLQFEGENDLGVNFWRDIRGSENARWSLVFDSESEILLSWEVSEIPQDLSILLKTATEQIDMRAQTELQLHEGSYKFEVILRQGPQSFTLEQNYPNPFNPRTEIRYQLPHVGSSLHTTLTIYNILGQEVRTLVNEVKEPGYYQVTWDARDDFGFEVSSGVYFYQIRTENFVETKRMLLMK